jgi:hypothetical protein
VDRIPEIMKRHCNKINGRRDKGIKTVLCMEEALVRRIV